LVEVDRSEPTNLISTIPYARELKTSGMSPKRDGKARRSNCAKLRASYSSFYLFSFDEPTKSMAMLFDGLDNDNAFPLPFDERD
jgi:hypothetical protein